MLLTTTLVDSHAATKISIWNIWQVKVSPGTVKIGRRRIQIKAETTLDIMPSEMITVKDEPFSILPLYDEKGAPWARGAKPHGLVTFETTAPDMLVVDSFNLKLSTGEATPLKRGLDYEIEMRWATFGRLVGGSIGADIPVYADYSYGKSRIDSIVVDEEGAVSVVQGKPHVSTPTPPQLQGGSIAFANIWVPGRLTALTAENIYPILESKYPDMTSGTHAPAETLLPKTWTKLTNGQPLKILAWGDSVTDGGQASDSAHQYQRRFESLLQKKFPAAAIHLSTVAWGGRNTDSFLQEPPGSPYNFTEKIIGTHPDLIIMEFVNDAYMTPAVVEQKYSYLLKRFQEIGAEWIILTPHYVRPDWMGVSNVRVESDPRPYVAGLRQFAKKHNIALADASLRWGHLLKEGIPYITLLSNSINHPDDRGHEMFAQSLIEFFGGQ